MRTTTLLAAFFSAAALWPAGAAAADADRGRQLYAQRCWVCHDSSVHSRAPRAATDLDAVRRYIERWERELGGGWSAQDIDDVLRFLNERYYRYPCPTALCPPARAAL